MRHLLSGLLGLAFVAAIPGGARATAIVDLGTAGRAASFIDSSCGKAARPALQSGEGIIPARTGCDDDGPTLSETFTIPAGAFDIALTIAVFSGSGTVRLQIGDLSIETADRCDDDDCDRENGGHGGGSFGRGGVFTDFKAGGTYSLDIVFRGLGDGDDRDDRTRAAIADLTASLTYATGAPNVQLRQAGNAGTAPAVPEPASALILPAALALLAWRRRSGVKRRR